MITTANPEASALNQVRREAEEAGVLHDYLETLRALDTFDRMPTITECRGIIQELERKSHE
ncbi:MAG: hypothetical protein U1D67_05385 [Dehalococcoidia bacterium]|nr:hypothetical protein [Dehalococcoidia bacterium]